MAMAERVKSRTRAMKRMLVCPSTNERSAAP
jgi:hypothetical protein